MAQQLQPQPQPRAAASQLRMASPSGNNGGVVSSLPPPPAPSPPGCRPPGVREVGSLASWAVTTAKPGNGVDALRDGSASTYWQCVSRCAGELCVCGRLHSCVVARACARMVLHLHTTLPHKTDHLCAGRTACNRT